MLGGAVPVIFDRICDILKRLAAHFKLRNLLGGGLVPGYKYI
jgi:hypothetical protein